MSDFMAIVANEKAVLHLVDWDRPCWFRADDPTGDRLIPGLDSMLTDALLLFFQDQFELDIDPFEKQRNGRSVINVNELPNSQELNEARKSIQVQKARFILFAHFGNLDAVLERDISLHSTPILTARIDATRANRFGIG